MALAVIDVACWAICFAWMYRISRKQNTLLDEIKKQQADRAASGSFKDTEVFYLLVFLYRMGLLRTNGRPGARLFIEFLRGQFPQAPELKREESRIIVP